LQNPFLHLLYFTSSFHLSRNHKESTNTKRIFFVVLVVMGKLHERFAGFINNRWLVFVAAMWIQSCAGIGYLFGSISPVIKSSLNYNQRQLASLGVAKDLGDSVGFLAGSLSEILPLWGALLVGAVQNLVGYGWVWLVVTGRAPVLPLWAVSIY
jgi:hypothetical protein